MLNQIHWHATANSPIDVLSRQVYPFRVKCAGMNDLIIINLVYRNFYESDNECGQLISAKFAGQAIKAFSNLPCPKLI